MSNCEKCGLPEHAAVDWAHTCATAAPRDMQPVSVETLTWAMQEIDLLPKPDKWIVIDPQGQMYKGTVEQMTLVLVQAHPLMRTPFETERKP